MTHQYPNYQQNYYGEYGPQQFNASDPTALGLGEGSGGDWHDNDNPPHKSRRRSSRDSRDRRRHRRRSRSRSQSRSRSRSRERRHRDRSRSRSRSRERGSNRDNRQRSYRSSDRNEYGSRDRSSRNDRFSRGYEEESGNASNSAGSHNLEDDKPQGFDHSKRMSGNDWRSKLASIRDAHFNRNKQAPSAAQNTFKNDGSFLEMFKKQMAGKGEDASSSVTPNSLVLASSSIPYGDGLSLPPLMATPLSQEPQGSSSSAVDDQDVDGVPMATHKSLPMPVSVGKRRLAKPLKTGIVFKKPQEPAEDEASQEKLDAWSRYLQEVQKYKSANCTDEDVSRPLVK